ncbi:hypothetical protein [Pseudomonas sp. PWP3-1b2]|uniref:hypothetical protein n=1 Tax=Pseudomonas sp. PWP3-1b2 TaxID=2804656 RepID=UPI003CF3259C
MAVETSVAIGNAMPSELRRGLENLWKLCNGLSEDAVRCRDRLIFDHQDWQSIRESATVLLKLMGHVEIAPFLTALTVDCQNEVDGCFAAKPERS